MEIAPPHPLPSRLAMTDEKSETRKKTAVGKLFPVGGGAVGELIRSTDWSDTPMGPSACWSPTFRTSLQNALQTTFPMAVCWGPDLHQFYNDDFAALMGAKHPRSLGQTAQQNWSEVWDSTGPLFEAVMTHGRCIKREEMLFVIERRGFPEETYFTFSYSPILEGEQVEGLLVTVTETTDQVISKRRLKNLSQLGIELSRATGSDDVLRRSLIPLEDNHRDVPFALLFAQGIDQDRAELVKALRIPRDTNWAPSWIELIGEERQDDPFWYALTSRKAQLIDLTRQFGPPPQDNLNPSSPIPHQALVVPLLIGPSHDEVCVGCYVFALNPSIPFDDAYRQFLLEYCRAASIAYGSTRETEEELDTVRARAELVQKRAESRRLQERAQLLDSFQTPFYGVDRRWRVVYANAAARDDPHFAASRLTGQNLWELFPFARGTEVEARFSLVMQEDESVELEFRSPLNDRLYLIRAFPWVEGISVTFLDITDQRETALALARSEARFRAVVEASMDVIAITDRDSHFRFVSPAAEAILGYTADQLLDTCLFDLLPSEGACAARGAFTSLHGQADKPVEFRSPILGDDGQETGWISAKACNLLEHPGVDGVLLNIRDITEVRRYERELINARLRAEEMTHLKSSILTNMSHEIRTPLTSVIGMANVLAKQIPDQYKAYARQIERGGLRLSQTLDAVLTFAQIESQSIDLQLTDVDLVREVRSAVQSLRRLAVEKSLDLRVTYHDEPRVRADPSFLINILNNLLGNAIKFTEQGQITVHIDRDDHHGIIMISDTGIGISAEFLPYVFDEFRQESTGLARSHQGAGLGLTITRRMVEAMNGTITVLSTRGVGTTFTITLPRHFSPSVTTKVTSTNTTDDPSPDDPPAALVVEDDQTIREMLVPILSPHFEVTTAASAESALAAAMQKRFDLVIMDIGLPDMDGVNALRYLLTIPGYDDRPIVALTGYALPDDHRRFTEAGFTEHIAKPFVPDELRDRLLELVH